MSKILSTTVSITQFLADQNCTYDEVDKIVELLQSWIKQARENNEYKTIANYISGNKLKSVNNDVIQPLNHVEPYC